MTFVLGLLAVTAVVSSILLMAVILLQEPKGGGIAAALGGSGMEAIGVNTGSVNKFTTWVAVTWVVACFAHAIMMPAATTIRAGTDAGADSGADTGGSGTPALPPGDDTPK